MAEKKIALSLKIDGVEYSIEQLEKLSNKAKEVEQSTSNITGQGAKGLDEIGNSAEKAAQKTDTLKQSSEVVGLTIDKQLQNFTKFATGVTGAFSAAATAATLFGADSSKATKFAENAQKAFNVVLGASAAIESVLALKKLLTVSATQKQAVASGQAAVAEGVQTAATLSLAAAEGVATTATFTLTGALNALGAAIKANPIGLILTVLSVAAAAMTFFGDETDNTADAVAKLDNETRKLIQTQDELLAKTQRATELELAKAQARNASLEDLRDIRQKEINTEISVAQEKLRILTNAKAAEEKIIDKSNLKLEEKNKKKLEIEQKYGNQLYQQQQAQLVAKNKLAIDNVNTEAEIRERNIRIANKQRDLEVSLIQNNLARKLAELRRGYEKEAEEEKKNLQLRRLIYDNYVQDRAETIAEAEKANLQLQIKIAKELGDVILNNYQLQLRNLQIYNKEQLQIFLDSSKELNEALNVKTDTEYKTIVNGQEVIYKLTYKQANALVALQQTYAIQESNLRKQNEINSLKSLQDAQNKELLIRAKTLEDVTGSQDELLKTQLDIYNKEFDAFKKSELDKLEYLAKIEAEKKGLSSESEDPKKVQEFLDFITTQKAGYEKLLETIRKTGKEEIELNTKKFVQQTQIDALIKESTLIRLEAEKSYYDNIVKKQEEFVTNDKMTKKQLEDNEREYRRKVRDEELRYAQESLMIQKKLIEDKIKLLEKDPTINAEALKTLYAELSKITADYNNNVRQQNANTATDSEEKFQDLIGNIQKVVDQFSQTIGQIGSLLSQSYSLQLEQLELDYQNTLSQIVGDTNEANILREKEEIMYQNKKKAIEKKARIDSLNIQLAQAVADSASAVLKTLAQYGATPVGIALSILAGGLGLVQIGLITQQKNMVQSMARGGFLRGPSHEQGGIKYQGGGVELEGNEAVINRRSTLQYAPLLSQINEQGGGKPIYVNSIMDSRMAEVLASTRNEPIRAYVLEQDITKSQAVNRRLEELASF